MIEKRTMPQHLQAKAAKKIDVYNRLQHVTRAVYLNEGQETANDREVVNDAFSVRIPSSKSEYKVFFGDLHCHTNFSDGSVCLESVLEKMAERVDFCAVTDHDHGGLWKDTLYTDKWNRLKNIVASKNVPGIFTPILGYERDSYPWYDNMIIYFNEYSEDLLTGDILGEIDERELALWLKREDIFIAPHDTTALTCSTNFIGRRRELLPHGFEIISRGDCAEYFDHPLNVCSSVLGGSYQDALEAGAHIAVIAGADSHDGTGALDCEDMGFPCRYPGMTGLWAKENTLESIFEALKQRRTFAFMGPKRITLDFRVNGHFMGACIKENRDAGGREIYFSVESEVPVFKVTVVKNNTDFFVTKGENINCCTFVDYECQRKEDWYYLRVVLTDGRQAWSSPCWIERDVLS